MNSKKLKKFALPVALVAGGLTAGSIFSPIGFASAQEDDTSETPTAEEETADSSESGERKRGSRKGRLARGEVAAEALGISQEDLKAGFGEGKSLSQMAEENGVDISELKATLTAQINERIDEAVAEGKIDADEAVEKKEAVAERVDKMVEATPGDRSERDGSKRQGKGHGQRGQKLEGAAEVLGLTTDEVREGLKEGKSLADMASEQGVSEDDLVAALVEGLQERVDAAVEEGKIDAEKAAERTENAEERIRSRVNGEKPERGSRDNNRGAQADADA